MGFGFNWWWQRLYSGGARPYVWNQLLQAASCPVCSCSFMLPAA